mmetsp:Transcript_7436/g.13271  ORF Transcript_7436/g.13271 Transcript_7436/m.13271 type:complete len:184 (-) Transcript_7436:21-572(-)
MKDGSASCVLAKEVNGEPAVCAKLPLDDDDLAEMLRLRLELSGDGQQMSGALVRSCYMQLVGSCALDATFTSASARFGFSAHGGSGGPDRKALFADFSGLAVQANRVQWNGTGGLQPPPAMVDPGSSPYQPDGDEEMPPPPGAGLTISSMLSEEERKQVAAMLLSAQAASGDSSEQKPVLPGP